MRVFIHKQCPVFWFKLVCFEMFYLQSDLVFSVKSVIFTICDIYHNSYLEEKPTLDNLYEKIVKKTLCTLPKKGQNLPWVIGSGKSTYLPCPMCVNVAWLNFEKNISKRAQYSPRSELAMRGNCRRTRMGCLEDSFLRAFSNCWFLVRGESTQVRAVMIVCDILSRTVVPEREQKLWHR